MDISPFEKKNKYISYEQGKRIILEELTNKAELNVNIICEKDCNSVPHSNFYLFFYILYWIISLIIIYIITKFFYSNYKFKINLTPLNREPIIYTQLCEVLNRV